MIYHLCSIKIESKYQTAAFILRTLIVQLCYDRRLFGRLPRSLRKERKDFGSESIESLQGIFRDLVTASPYRGIYCVIDGLDVYSTGMDDLTGFLKSMYASCSQPSGPVLKIFCTSRPEPSILDAWDNLPIVDFRPDPKDLTTFIRSSTKSLPDRFDAGMRAQISSSLHDRAGRTFLWISIMIREVQTPAYTNHQRHKEDHRWQSKRPR